MKKKSERFYRNGFYILLIGCLLLGGMTLFLLIRGNYFSMLAQTMASDKESYNYERNASYVQRSTQFDMLPVQDVDIVFVGDSITARFEWDEYFTDYTVANRGIDSDVTEGVYNRLDTITSQTPEKIFLMVGINDIRQDIPAETTLSYYEKILDELKTSLPDCEIYIQSVLPVHTSTGIDNTVVQNLNLSLQQLAEQKGITYLDIYSAVVDADNNFTYTVDGVHPTGEGYVIWTGILETILK
ncbi:MAG: hypothetical protein IJ429_05775 [Lachnospiraceae bacterium]|nr:hypothetical protein [Lachnospiraceae bacterium]